MALFTTVHVRASSWDTQQRLPYNRNAPRKIKRPSETLSLATGSSASSISKNLNSSRISSATAATTQKEIDVNELLKLNTTIFKQADSDEATYLGYERWLPSSPKVEKPRSTYNAAALAYIGDCIYETRKITVKGEPDILDYHLHNFSEAIWFPYKVNDFSRISSITWDVALYDRWSGKESHFLAFPQLYARRHFLAPALNIEEYNDRVMAVVRCEAQDALLQKLFGDKLLSNEERDVLRWGKNVTSTKTRTKKRAGVAVYNRASSLETLIGYLYLTNVARLDEVMSSLGFSVGASNQTIVDDLNSEMHHMKQKQQNK